MRPRENPFAPPRSDLSSKPVERGSPVVAVIAGVAADIGGSFLSFILMGVGVGVTLGLQGMSPERIREVLTQTDPYSLQSILGYALGSVFSVVGGYVCARVARHAEYKLAGIVAAIGVTLGLLMGSGQLPAALNALLTVLSVLAVLGGAWLGAARNRFRT